MSFASFVPISQTFDGGLPSRFGLRPIKGLLSVVAPRDAKIRHDARGRVNAKTLSGLYPQSNRPPLFLYSPPISPRYCPDGWAYFVILRTRSSSAQQP